MMSASGVGAARTFSMSAILASSSAICFSSKFCTLNGRRSTAYLVLAELGRNSDYRIKFFLVRESFGQSDPYFLENLKGDVLSLVSSAENSSLDFNTQYAYIEDIGDGRGYTAGVIGFTSGTGDMIEVVKRYVALKPKNNTLKK